MSLHVICPGCLKRFQVSARFAGMKGPCPSCGEIISIPKESVKIHGDDDVVSGKQGKKRSNVFRPIPRLDLDIAPTLAGRYALIALGALLLTFVLGCIPMPGVLRLFIGVLGLGLVAFPLSLFGYWIMLDREQIFVFSGEELYRRTGIVAAGYVLLWLVLEYYLAATKADLFISGLYFSAFALLATSLVHPLLELKTRDAFFHYCIFAVSVALLRFCIGFGWFWSNEWHRYSAAPPPPLLPGM